MSKPIFLLGLGNTKSGTSWLHSHLVNHPETAFHLNLAKEYNLVENGYAKRNQTIWNPPQWKLLARYHRWEWRQKLHGQPVTIADSHEMLGLPRKQFLSEFAQHNAMRWVFSRQARRFRVVGDISPNSIFNPPLAINTTIQSLREDFDVRGVMMWRDPLTRLESMYKHTKRASFKRLGRAFERTFARNDFNEIRPFSQLAALETLAVLDIQPHHILHEELFSPEGQAVLDTFHSSISIQHKTGRFEQMVNESAPHEAGFNVAQRQIMNQGLRPEYEKLAEFFGETRLRAIWNFPEGT